jgi:4-alpha-glucanotransferase
MRKRYSGIIMPVFSFPSKDAIGTLDDPQRYLPDFRNAGFRRFHVLPLTPTIIYDSPFQGPSLLYGNPNLIGIDSLMETGDLSEAD